MSNSVHFCLVTVHLLAGAAWFGALVYRTFFVDPRIWAFFTSDSPQPPHGGVVSYNKVSLDFAHGMRYVVMFALATLGLTGGILVGYQWPSSSGTWQGLMWAKTALFTIGCGIFAYISWRYWPKRVFASDDEIQRSRGIGFILSLLMISIALLGSILGIAMRFFSSEPMATL
ncbi:MAG: hypothetical protein R3B84_12295 [Zavarzinella sp.]